MLGRSQGGKNWIQLFTQNQTVRTLFREDTVVLTSLAVDLGLDTSWILEDREVDILSIMPDKFNFDQYKPGFRFAFVINPPSHNVWRLQTIYKVIGHWTISSKLVEAKMPFYISLIERSLEEAFPDQAFALAKLTFD